MLVCFGCHGYMNDFLTVQSRLALMPFWPIQLVSRWRLDALEAGLVGASITSCTAACKPLRFLLEFITHSGPGTSLNQLLRIYLYHTIYLFIKCELSSSEWRHLGTRVRSRNWVTRLRAGWAATVYWGIFCIANIVQLQYHTSCYEYCVFEYDESDHTVLIHYITKFRIIVLVMEDFGCDKCTKKIHTFILFAHIVYLKA